MNHDFAAVVRRHWKDTAGYLVAGREPCIKIARDEVRLVKRRLTFVGHEGLSDLRPEGSWFMAVVVCTDDGLDRIAEWAHDNDAKRIHFYLHADADAAQLMPWRDAGLPLDHITEGITSWRGLHKLLGMDLNMQVYDDHRPG
ncbi:MAG: hypothetical protein KY455_02995 [Euryarchaeota archaeon]|nr:hypothetical protein [Euryarchaeota archaeon]